MFSDNIMTLVMELNAIKIAVARSLVATGGSDVQLLSIFNSLDALHTSYKPMRCAVTLSGRDTFTTG